MPGELEEQQRGQVRGSKLEGQAGRLKQRMRELQAIRAER